MKILIATETYFPNISGAAVFTRNIAKGMLERGHQVVIIAQAVKFANYKEKEDGIIIYRQRSIKNPFRIGYRIPIFPFLNVHHIVHKFSPDVIHLQGPAFIGLATLLAAKKYKIPVIATHHFSTEFVISYLKFIQPLAGLIAKIMWKYLTWFYNKCHLVTCPSQTTANALKKYPIKTPILAISNGIDLKQFSPRLPDGQFLAKFNIPKKKPVVLHVGRLDVDKKVDIIIKAVPFVLKEIEATFVIAGMGKEMENLKNLAKKLKVEKNIIFTEKIDYKDIVHLYQIATLFVTASPIETQGIVVMEAMACKKPVVGANAGALPELIFDGQNGYLFSPGDYQQLAQKIIQMIKSPQLLVRMGEKSYSIISHHSIINTFNRFEEIYLELQKELRKQN